MPSTKKARKPAKKPKTAPTSAALEKHTQKVLTELLITVLKTAALRKKAGISLRGLDEVSISCDVNFVTTAQMKKVNAKYRGKNKDTDVLSFPAPKVFRKQGILGEILISKPVLLAQAKSIGHSWKDELAVLLAHGVLHLLDFDHERGEKDARTMRTWEKKLLKAPGLTARGHTAQRS